ncbi:helix-turn-helix domain-containing protein [Erwinia sp. CGal63]|uniref:helix-turn-helix domain-containing protein n=1 Tax=Erwinia sp. CGal63 TaxID=2919889 RepID=UPI0030093451
MSDKIDTKSRHLTKADGNVFADLGFAPEEAASLLAQSQADIARTKEMKQQMMTEIARWIAEHDYKQEIAAKMLQVSRPRVSDVVNKKTHLFTLDALVSMLSNIGKKVRLVIE